MERPDVRPEEPHLLLTRPDDLFAIAEGDLQAEAIRDGRQDISDRGRRVGAEVRQPPG